jgi:hypothetical protein
VTPKDRLERRLEAIFKERDRRLQEARDRRKAHRETLRGEDSASPGAKTSPNRYNLIAGGIRPPRTEGYPGQTHPPFGGQVGVGGDELPHTFLLRTCWTIDLPCLKNARQEGLNE